MRRAAKLATYAILASWSLVCLIPITWLALTSIKGVESIDKPPGYVPFLDFSPSLEAWRFIFFDHNENLVGRLLNSVIVGGVSTVICLVVGVMAIYSLTRFPARSRWTTLGGLLVAATCTMVAFLVVGTVARMAMFSIALAAIAFAVAFRRRGAVISASAAISMMLVTRVLVPAVLVVPLYVMASATGTQDTLTILVPTYTAINLPLAVWLLSPVLGSRATDQEEAAQIDGASHVCILVSVVMPMVRPALTATGLIIFLMCWNEYLFAAHLATDHAQTLPPWAVGQLSMKEAQVGGGAEELAHLSAATILMILPVLAFAALVQKQLGRSVLWRGM